MKRDPDKLSTYRRRRRLWEYMAWVKTQPCELRDVDGAGECYGGVEADHAGEKPGLSQKAPDDTCIPLCSRHHRHRETSDGLFRLMTRDQRLEWRLAAIARIQLRWQSWQRALEVF